MAQTAFDTLSIARRLEKEYGFEARQAEGVAEVVYENLVGNVATKEDITRLEQVTKEDIAAVRRELKEGLAAVREEMLRMENRFVATFATKAELYKLIGAQTAVIVGLMLALKFIP